MTTQLDARRTVYTEFLSGTSLSNVTFANENYTAPADTNWARLTVLHEAGEQDTLGTTGERKFMRRARVLIQIFGPVDNGIGSLDTLAQESRSIFEGKTLDGNLYFTNVDIRESGPDGEWYQLIVDAPFDYRETL